MWIIDWIIKNAEQVYDVLSRWYWKIRSFAVDAYDMFWSFFLETWPSSWNNLQRRADRALRFFRDGLDWLIGTYDSIWRQREEWFFFLFRGLSDITGWWYSRVHKMFTQMFWVLEEVYERLINGIRWYVNIVKTQVEWLAVTAFNTLKWLAETVIQQIRWLTETAFNTLKWLAETVIQQIRWLAVTAFNTLKWLAETVIDQIRWLVVTAFNTLKWLAETVIHQIRWLAVTAFNTLKWLAETVIDKIRWLVETVYGFLVWLFQTAKGAIEFIVSQFDKVKMVFSSSWDFLNSFLTNPLTVIFELVFNLLLDLILAFIYYIFLPTERK